jgi:hypothetical protein
LTTLREKLVKIGAKVVSHARYVTFQMAEVIAPRGKPAIRRNHSMRSVSRHVTVFFLVATAFSWMSFSSATDGAPMENLASDLEPIREKYDFPSLAAAVILDGRIHAAGVVGVRKHGAEVPAELNDPFDHHPIPAVFQRLQVLQPNEPRREQRFQVFSGDRYRNE